MKRISALLTSAFFCISLNAHADFNPITVGLGSGTSCTRANIEIATLSSGILKESYRVSSSGDEFDFESAPFAASAGTINGSVTREVPFPASAKTSSLIGVSYKLGGADLSDDTHAEFFVVYSCSQNTPLYTCTGRKGSCPVSIDEYLPHLSNESSDSGDFGTISDRNRHMQYFTVANRGFGSMTIGSATIEGANPEVFSVHPNYPLPHPLDASGYDSYEVRFKTNKIGTFSAQLRIHPTSSLIQDLVIPLHAATLNLPSLSISVNESVKVGKIKGRKAIVGSFLVKNIGIASSRAGAHVEITIRGNSYYQDLSTPTKLLSIDLPELRPGQSKVLSYASVGHNFSQDINKIISLKLVGSKRQRGLSERKDSFSVTDYIYATPVK